MGRLWGSCGLDAEALNQVCVHIGGTLDSRNGDIFIRLVRNGDIARANFTGDYEATMLGTEKIEQEMQYPSRYWKEQVVSTHSGQ